jgi:hypothetical protein
VVIRIAHRAAPHPYSLVVAIVLSAAALPDTESSRPGSAPTSAVVIGEPWPESIPPEREKDDDRPPRRPPSSST